MELLTLKQKLWAVGLFWDEHRAEKVISHKTLKEEKNALYDTFAKYQSPQGVQYGFASLGKDWKFYSKATALATVLGNIEYIKPQLNRNIEVFIGLFKLKNTKNDEFWWLHVKVNKEIPRMGDAVFKDRKDAFQMLDLMENFTGLNRGLSVISETVEESEQFLENAIVYTWQDKYFKSTGHLANLNKYVSRATVIKGIALGLLILLVFAAFKLPKKYQESLVLLAYSEAQIAERQRIKDAKDHPEKLFAKPWQTNMYPADVARFCLREMMQVPLSSNAWDLFQVDCNGRVMNVEWRFGEGADFMALPMEAKLDEKNPRVARTSKRLSFDKDEVHKRADGENTSYKVLLTREYAMGLMSQVTKSTLAKLSPLIFKPQEKKVVSKMPVLAPWHYAQWQLSHVPEILLDDHAHENGIFKMMADIPGLSINSIIFSVGNGWTVKGDLYARHQ